MMFRSVLRAEKPVTGKYSFVPAIFFAIFVLATVAMIHGESPSLQHIKIGARCAASGLGKFGERIAQIGDTDCMDFDAMFAAGRDAARQLASPPTSGNRAHRPERVPLFGSLSASL